MLILSYCILMATILIFVIMWKSETNNSIFISPFLLFSVYDIMGIVTAIKAYNNGIASNLYPFFIYVLSFLAFCTATFLTKKSTAFSKAKIGSYYKTEFQKENYSVYYVPLYIFIIIITGIGLYLYKGIPYSAKNLVSLFQGTLSRSDSIALSEFRRELTKSYYFGGNYTGSGLFRTVIRYGWEFIDVFALVLFMKDKSRKGKNFLLLLFAITFSYIFVSGDGTRFQIFRVFLVIFVAFALVKRLRFGKAAMIGAFAVAFLIVVSMTSNKMNVQSTSGFDAVQDIIDRIVSGNQINDIYVMQWYQDGIMEHYYGQQHVVQFLNALPGVSGNQSFSYVIAQIYGSGSSTTYMSPTYLSILYADFGGLGVIAGYAIIGVVISHAERIVYSMKKNLLNFALTSVIILDFGFMTLTGLVKILPELLTIVVLFYLMRFLITFYREVTQKERRGYFA